MLLIHGSSEISDVIFHSERFFDREGRTYESVGLHPDRLMVLHFDSHRERLPPTNITHCGYSEIVGFRCTSTQPTDLISW